MFVAAESPERAIDSAALRGFSITLRLPRADALGYLSVAASRRNNSFTLRTVSILGSTCEIDAHQFSKSTQGCLCGGKAKPKVFFGVTLVFVRRLMMMGV